VKQIAEKIVDILLDCTKRKQVKPKPKANTMPMPPAVGRAGIGQPPSHFPAR